MRNTITLIVLTIVTFFIISDHAYAQANETTASLNTPQLVVDWEPWDPGTVVLQSLIGAGAGAGLGIATGVLYDENCEEDPFSDSLIGECALGAVGLGTLVGMTTTVLGVQLTGWAMGGNGHVGGTLLGVFAGGALAISMISLMGPVGLVLAPLAPTAGAVIGYHATATMTFHEVAAVTTDGGAVFQATWRF